MNEGPSLKISIYCDCLQFLISPAAHQTIPGGPGPVSRVAGGRCPWLHLIPVSTLSVTAEPSLSPARVRGHLWGGFNAVTRCQ